MSFCPSKDIHSVYLDGELPENYKAVKIFIPYTSMVSCLKTTRLSMSFIFLIVKNAVKNLNS